MHILMLKSVNIEIIIKNGFSIRMIIFLRHTDNVVNIDTDNTNNTDRIIVSSPQIMGHHRHHRQQRQNSNNNTDETILI